MHTRSVVVNSAFRGRVRASSGRRGSPGRRGVVVRESCRKSCDDHAIAFKIVKERIVAAIRGFDFIDPIIVVEEA